MATPAWLPMAIPSVGIVVSVTYYAWQVHRASFNQSIDLLFKLEGDFFGANKRAQRVKASRDLLAGRSLEAEPILDFFETTALLMRRGALDKEIVWHTFFYWIDRYYEACKQLIADRQQQDPLVWKDLSAMVLDLRAFQRSQTDRPTYSPPSAQEVVEFLTEELTEAD